MLIVLVGSALVVGMAAAVLRPLDQNALLLAAGVSAAALALGWRGLVSRSLALGCLLASTAALRVVLWPAPVDDALSPYVGQTVALRGHVHSPPTLRGRALTFRLQADAAQPVPDPRTESPSHVAAAQAPAEARPGLPALTSEARLEVVLMADHALAHTIALGDRLELRGQLTRPAAPAGFNRSDQLRRDGVFSQLAFAHHVELLDRGTVAPGTLLPTLRTAAAKGIQHALPEPQASLAVGMLLGGSGNLSPAFRHDLQSSGLAHLMAIDGFKQVVVAGGLAALASRVLDKRRAVPVVLAGIAAYTLLTGAPASAVRAGLMVGMALLAGAFGRIADPLTGLVIAATLMCLAEPLVLLDIGFQLSYSAVLGLILLYPRLRGLFHHLPRWAADPAGLTVAVTLSTLPVTLAVFREVSLVSPLAHVVAAPLIAPVMLSAAALALALPVPPLAQVVAWVAWLPATLLAETIHVFGSMPGASVFTGALPPAAGPAVAIVLLAWCLLELPEAGGLRYRFRTFVRERHWATWRSAGLVAVSAAACLVLLAWRAPLRPDGLLHVHVLASGRGQATLVRGPDGSTVLVSGPSVDARGLASLVGDALSVWERQLDAVVVLDSAHVPWLAETLRRYPARESHLAVDDLRLPLGGGAVLDVFASHGPGVAVSYGETWLRITGSPPPVDDAVVALVDQQAPPAGQPLPLLRVAGPGAPNGSATTLAPAPRESRTELISDGITIWTPASDH